MRAPGVEAVMSHGRLHSSRLLLTAEAAEQAAGSPPQPLPPSPHPASQAKANERTQEEEPYRRELQVTSGGDQFGTLYGVGKETGVGVGRMGSDAERVGGGGGRRSRQEPRAILA